MMHHQDAEKGGRLIFLRLACKTGTVVVGCTNNLTGTVVKGRTVQPSATVQVSQMTA